MKLTGSGADKNEVSRLDTPFGPAPEAYNERHDQHTTGRNQGRNLHALYVAARNVFHGKVILISRLSPTVSSKQKQNDRGAITQVPGPSCVVVVPTRPWVWAAFSRS
jgi:hypothetical protein